MSAALPRVFVTAHRVYITWPESPHGLHTSVINLGRYLDDVFGWPQNMPADVVELVQAEPLEGP